MPSASYASTEALSAAAPFVRRRVVPSLLTLPLLLYLIPFYLGALGFLFVFSFYEFKAGGRLLSGVFTIENYVRLFGRHHLDDLTRTIWVGIVSAGGTVVIAYPMAYWLARSVSRWKSICFAVVVLSMLVVSVVRVFAWTVVLGRMGFINRTLELLGLINQPLPLLYNVTSVIVVEIHYLLPFVTLTLLAGLQRIDPTLELAAKNLGSRPWHTFLTITLPLSLPGVAAALSLAFALTVSSFTTPMIIGGGRVDLLANVIYDIMLNAHNFPFASALSIAALVLSVAVMAVLSHAVVSRLKA
jgi:putative spermidine/putrescine transport system permease protein